MLNKKYKMSDLQKYVKKNFVIQMEVKNGKGRDK